MRFESSQRVVYAKNPLVEVICQLRFQRILRIEAEPPAAFQESIRAAYPKLRELHTLRIPDELAQLIGMDVGASSQRSFEFTDPTDTWKVSLTSGFVAVSTTAYVRWEEFSRKLTEVMDALGASYGLTSFTRIGLRYRDVLRRSTVGLLDVPWTDLLKPELLGELKLVDFASSVRESHRQIVLSLDYDDAAVRFAHGLMNDEQEQCYWIDADFARDHETERSDAGPILDKFNSESGRLFRWCITQRLHDAMGPAVP